MAGRPVAAVVGPDGSLDTTEWAVEECLLRGAPLTLTTAPAEREGPRRSTPASFETLEDVAHGVRRRHPRLDVSTDRSGAPGLRHLVALSERVDLLVVPQADHEPDLDELLTDALAPLPDRLAVHAGCPVAVVPAAPPTGRLEHGRVVMGWSPGRSGRVALTVAAEEAVLRGCWLTLVHVPRPTDPEVRRALGDVDHETALLRAVAAVERTHRGVVVDLVVRQGDPVQELGLAGSSADLLVLGCHHSRHPWTDRPGQVAAALRRRAPCPVLLVGTAHRLHETGPARPGHDQVTGRSA